ncbi:MAG: hypothetical protein MZW92_34965 [Comamonadaceae bacterium]|nr:hypothetical protein [Comamonadaceae bacterium]
MLDPPKFAPTAAACRARRARLQGHQPPGAEAAGAGRAAAHLLAARAASAPSCSTRSSPARRWTPASTARSCSAWRPRRDHPTTLFFPEGEYLKGLAILDDA